MTPRPVETPPSRPPRYAARQGHHRFVGHLVHLSLTKPPPTCTSRLRTIPFSVPETRFLTADAIASTRGVWTKRLDLSVQALFHFCYGATVSSAALVGGIAKVYTPEVGVTVVVERVPWIVPSVDPSKVCPP